MEIRIFKELPICSADIRNEVFVQEQGFQEEFDSYDETATHIVGFIEDKAVATSRVLTLTDGKFLIGRIAVRQQYRKMGLGSKIISASEKFIIENGGREIFIHAQMQAVPFYEKQGYSPIGEQDEDEGCPHQMMNKIL